MHCWKCTDFIHRLIDFPWKTNRLDQGSQHRRLKPQRQENLFGLMWIQSKSNIFAFLYLFFFWPISLLPPQKTEKLFPVLSCWSFGGQSSSWLRPMCPLGIQAMRGYMRNFFPSDTKKLLNTRKRPAKKITVMCFLRIVWLWGSKYWLRSRDKTQHSVISEQSPC